MQKITETLSVEAPVHQEIMTLPQGEMLASDNATDCMLEELRVAVDEAYSGAGLEELLAGRDDLKFPGSGDGLGAPRNYS